MFRREDPVDDVSAPASPRQKFKARTNVMTVATTAKASSASKGRLLSDIAAIAAILGAVCFFAHDNLPNTSPLVSHFHTPMEFINMTNGEETRKLYSGRDDDASSSTRSEEEPAPIHHVVDAALGFGMQPPKQVLSISKGDVVEIYGDESHFAIPATVDEVLDNGRYSLVDGLSNRKMSSVGPQYIHRYTPYVEGTSCFCNVSNMRAKINVTPCQIVEHNFNLSRKGKIYYKVTFLNSEQNQVELWLPYTKVQKTLLSNVQGVVRG
mmetsp:Transcript_35699/g.85146  ORF Transcript_35699/g.85146 Transcript_35699/m.85146 type:complete len:266 (-) Transcript_35699:73-870(-)